MIFAKCSEDYASTAFVGNVAESVMGHIQDALEGSSDLLPPGHPDLDVYQHTKFRITITVEVVK
jgi:hypothetical protein